jgi:hypothetical protein
VEVASYRLNYRTFLARFRFSLTEDSSVSLYISPLEMTEGTKWRRTKGLRPRCTRNGSSVAAIPVYLCSIESEEASSTSFKTIKRLENRLSTHFHLIPRLGMSGAIPRGGTSSCVAQFITGIKFCVHRRLGMVPVSLRHVGTKSPN